jgi:hypothetical protein
MPRFYQVIPAGHQQVLKAYGANNGAILRLNFIWFVCLTPYQVALQFLAWEMKGVNI